MKNEFNFVFVFFSRLPNESLINHFNDVRRALYLFIYELLHAVFIHLIRSFLRNC